jgi:UDP-galactose transporter B1
MMNKNFKFIGTALGIFFCYFYYGILQETITRGKYANDEKFTFTLSLVFTQCVVNYLYSIIILQISPPAKNVSAGPQMKKSLYAICALTYILAMVTSNMSLQWVSYPTQVVAKSCKPIPVMVLGVLVGGRSYSLRKYLFVFSIVIGVGLFMYNPNKASKSSAPGGLGVGELLLIVSLAMDGLTGAVQERMRSGAAKLNSGLLMKYMNLYSVGYLLVAIIVTQEIFTFPAFISRHPSVLPNIILFCLTSALGQFFIYMMVTDFGPLPCSIVTTTRKFFTVLFSVFFFGNLLTELQWFGAAVVFLGLSLDAVYKG